MPDHNWTKVNPNEPSKQNYQIKISKNPTPAANHTCIPMGVIRFTVNGVTYFSPYKDSGANAVQGPEAEILAR